MLGVPTCSVSYQALGVAMISAVVLAKNEEKNIAECLRTLRWCDEIVVIDDYSQDKTAEIAKKFSARVYKRHLNDNFAAQRNFALKKTAGVWVLFVDADERVTEALAWQIKQKTENTKLNGFYIKRLDVVWGSVVRHGEAGSVWLLRLARRDAGRWKRAVHEVWEATGEIGQLEEPLFHHPHPTLHEFTKKLDWYSTLHAKENFAEGKKSSLWKIIFYPRLKFFQGWIFQRGFLDGMPGFMLAVMMSFHSFLAWSKLWLAARTNR